MIIIQYKKYSDKLIIIIPKRIVKLATKRNKIRRQIKVIAQENNINFGLLKIIKIDFPYSFSELKNSISFN